MTQVGGRVCSILAGLACLWSVFVVATALSACTYGSDNAADEESGSISILKVVSIDPAPGSINVARNQPITVKFNLPLNPDSVGRASLYVFSGILQAPGKLKTDLLDRSLVYTPAGTLRPELRYDFYIGNEFRGMDGATMSNEIAAEFTTGTQFLAIQATDEPVRASALQPLWDVHCGRCHSASRVRAGVDLSSPAAAERTLRNQRAQGASMMRVVPNDHARSYLMLKVLGEYGITGFPMPPVGDLLDAEQLRLIADWIDDGALAE